MREYTPFEKMIERDYERLKRYLFGVDNKRTEGLEDSEFEDVFHNTLLIALRRVPEKFKCPANYDENVIEIPVLRNYLARIFVHATNNYLKGKRKWARGALLIPTIRDEKNKLLEFEDPYPRRREEQEERQEKAEQLLKECYSAIPEMSPILGTPLLMYLNGKSPREIQKELKLPPDRVYRQICRAKSWLRDCFLPAAYAKA